MTKTDSHPLRRFVVPPKLPEPISPAQVQHAEPRAADVQNRVADAITRFSGSMKFVSIPALLFAVWMLVFERSPWPTLTLVVSLEAIFLSTFVMISQNRADAKREVLSNHQWQGIQKEDEQNQHLLTLTERIHDLSKQIHGLQTQTLDLTKALSDTIVPPHGKS